MYPITPEIIEEFKLKFPVNYALELRRYARWGGTKPFQECSLYRINDGGEVMETVEGDMQCGKCKSKRVKKQEVQTRSADESATVFCYCTSCGHRWKI